MSILTKLKLLADPWKRRYFQDRLFHSFYARRIFEMPILKTFRSKAYRRRYNMGKGCHIQYNVDISQVHHLPGTIKIGKNVLLAKNVFIDYSGSVEIKDNVQITNGVIIETHYHPWHSDYHLRHTNDDAIPTSITIEEGAVIGSRAILMASCHYVGKHARVGAGAVVTHDIPDYAVAVGVPAKVIRTQD